MKWQDVLIRVLVAALAALAGALTEQQHPGVLTGLVQPLGVVLGAPLVEPSDWKLLLPQPIPLLALSLG